MSTVVELNATEIANRLLPLLKEYAAKMADIAERSTSVLSERLSRVSVDVVAIEMARLICLHDTLNKPVSDLAREASGLIEHAALEYHLRGELKLRLDELEEHIRFAVLAVGQVELMLKVSRTEAERLRKLIEKSGRYKAPF